MLRITWAILGTHILYVDASFGEQLVDCAVHDHFQLLHAVLERDLPCGVGQLQEHCINQ